MVPVVFMIKNDIVMECELPGVPRAGDHVRLFNLDDPNRMVEAVLWVVEESVEPVLVVVLAP